MTGVEYLKANDCLALTTLRRVPNFIRGSPLSCEYDDPGGPTLMGPPQFYDTGSIKGNDYYKYVAELTLLVQHLYPLSSLTHLQTCMVHILMILGIGCPLDGIMLCLFMFSCAIVPH